MKKTIRILCGFVCLLSLVALVFTSCNFGTPTQNTTPSNGTTEDNPSAVTTPSETTNNDSPIDPLGRKIPVYQGMSISTSANGAMPSFEKNGNTDNNGNHNGWYKGDSVDNQGDVDQETPFPDADENIEEEIKDSLEVIGSKQDIYYAAQNQDIYIYIYLDNPDKFEILSFTLNGEKYSSYMFEYGSNMEVLILKYNVGDTSGVVEYTIDQIKYIDGNEIKDVKIGGDKTVKAGIRTEGQVTATVTNLQIGTNSISFNATISDKDGLIAYSQGNVKAVLYDGDILVAEKEISVGSNAVVFDGLKTGTVYQYAIVASYDAFDESGVALHILDKYAFQTNYVVLFDNIVIGQENISFTLVWDASVANKTLTSLKIYNTLGLQAGNELNTSATTVSGLLSANEYVLVAEYQNLGKTETISLTFTTFEKGVPGIFITNTTSTQTSVGFEIEETDTDNVGAVTKIELIHATGTVVADSLDQRTFANLLSNNTYTVKVTYAYDLNDGNGAQTITQEREIKTLAKAVPQISITGLSKTQTSIGFDISEIDTDSVGAVTKIELVHKNGTVVAESLDVRKFADLLSNNTYTIKVTYVYDLNDGNGAQTITQEREVQTLAKTVPEISVTNLTQTQTSVKFEIKETDTDNVGAITQIELVHQNGTVVADNIYIRSFSNLLSDNAYTVKVTYTYDLNDGNGTQTITAEENIKTLAKTAPQFVISNEKATSGNITADFTFTDVDSVLSSYKVELYNGETLVAQNAQNVINFTGLEYFIDYTITITYTYDLNDGKGVQTATATKSAKMVSTGFAYTVNADGTTCTITGMGTCTDTTVVIPDYIDGYKVTAIGENAFADNSTITAFMIPNTVDTICKRAFYKCTGIKEITIPESVWEIGTQIFLGCNKLTTVYYNGRYGSLENPFLNTQSIDTVVFGGKYVPHAVAYGATNIKTVIILDGVTGIDWDAFRGCANLITVSIPDSVTSISNNAFDGCSSLVSITIPNGVTEIDSRTFSGCSSLKYVSIPNSVTVIDYGAFEECSSLVSITLPSSLMSIGGDAFLNCSALASITIPDSVTSIDIQAFRGCRSLTSIVIPDGITEISDSLFCDCSSLTSITIPNSVTKIGPQAFWGCSNLTSITIPDGVTSIGSCAFNNCSSLTSITIPYGVTSIEDQTFGGCKSLISIAIPESVTSIGNNAFYDCSSLKDIIIPHCVTSIGYQTFSNCDSLTSIILPDGIEIINSFLFAYCDSLVSVTIPNNIKSIGEYAFAYCSALTSFTIPNSVINIGNYAFDGCYSLTDVYVTNLETWMNISFGNDAHPNRYGKLHILDSSGNEITELVIPDGFTDISDFTFCGYSSLISITIPDRVTNIGNYAFYGCSSLTNITIPDKVTNIGNYAFWGCNGLTSAMIGASVTSIGDNAFEGCYNLTNITIPNKVTSIGRCAFYECTSLTSIAIPNSVTCIGYSAFSCCIDLMRITFEGTSNQWNAISKGENWDLHAINYAVYCTNGILCKNHVEAIDEAVAPTCTETGLTEGKHCSVCGEILVAQEIVPATGIHTYEMVVVTVPTATENGVKKYTCSVCGDSYTEELIPIDFAVTADNREMIGYTGADGENLIIPAVFEYDSVWYRVTSIGNYAFQDCTNLKGITISNDVTSIGELAFYNCTSLESVTLSKNITSIGGRAFYKCRLLESITFEGTVEQWNAIAFGENWNTMFTMSIICSNGVVCLQHNYECTKTTEPTITENGVAEYTCSVCGNSYAEDLIPTDFTVTEYNREMIGYTGAEGENLVVPAVFEHNGVWYRVTSIGNYAFSNCKWLTSITIPESVTNIGIYAFSNCSSLTNITIPQGVSSIGYYAFYYCSNLTSITIPQGVTSIGEATFYYCSALTSIIIPQSVTSIGAEAFYQCNALTSITISQGVTNIGDYAFYYCNAVTSITIPNSVTNIGEKAFAYCTALTSITFDANSNLVSIGNRAFFSCGSLTSITIPDGVTSLGASMFYNCGALASITFGENSNLTSIGEWAFWNCISLNSIILPNCVTSIGEHALGNCSSLTSITIPESVTCIEEAAFYYCTALTSITIPQGVTSIGSNTFMHCHALTSITIPASVTSIGTGAFYSNEALTTITFKGTVEQWNAVAKADGWDEVAGDYIIYCIGDITLKLSMFESIFQKDSRGWCMYNDIMGSAVTEVLSKQDLLVASGCNPDDIYLAGDATENLRVLLKGYNDLRTKKWDSDYEKYKALYQYYTDNYDALEQNFCDLYKTLKGLYENTVVSNYIKIQGKAAHYRQLVGHLFVVSTALDQDGYRDEDAWRMDKKTLREVIEDVHYFPDGNWYPEELQ